VPGRKTICRIVTWGYCRWSPTQTLASVPRVQLKGRRCHATVRRDAAGMSPTHVRCPLWSTSTHATPQFNVSLASYSKELNTRHVRCSKQEWIMTAYRTSQPSCCHLRGLHGPKFYNLARFEDHLARPSPTPRFIHRCVTRNAPTTDLRLCQPEWSPIYSQSALSMVSLMHFLMHKCQ
jgi:hypothetical protein